MSKKEDREYFEKLLKNNPDVLIVQIEECAMACIKEYASEEEVGLDYCAGKFITAINTESRNEAFSYAMQKYLGTIGASIKDKFEEGEIMVPSSFNNFLGTRDYNKEKGGLEFLRVSVCDAANEEAHTYMFRFPGELKLEEFKEKGSSLLVPSSECGDDFSLDEEFTLNDYFSTQCYRPTWEKLQEMIKIDDPIVIACDQIIFSSGYRNKLLEIEYTVGENWKYGKGPYSFVIDNDGDYEYLGGATFDAPSAAVIIDYFKQCFEDFINDN